MINEWTKRLSNLTVFFIWVETFTVCKRLQLIRFLPRRRLLEQKGAQSRLRIDLNSQYFPLLSCPLLFDLLFLLLLWLHWLIASRRWPPASQDRWILIRQTSCTAFPHRAFVLKILFDRSANILYTMVLFLFDDLVTRFPYEVKPLRSMLPVRVQSVHPLLRRLSSLWLILGLSGFPYGLKSAFSLDLFFVLS